MSLRKISISVFNGSWNALIWSAIERGFFRENNLEILINYTSGSGPLIQGFYDGDYEIVFCSADNVLAYQENHAEVAIRSNPDAAIFISGDSGFLYPVGSSETKSIADLKGKVIGVDKKDTGFAYVLYDILKQNGVDLQDITIKEMGATEGRLAMVENNQCQMTLLRTPYQLLAKSRGLNVFNQYRMSLDMYQGTVGVVHRTWVKDNESTLAAFQDAYQKGLHWFIKNPTEAKLLLAKNLNGLSGSSLDKCYEELCDKNYGLDQSMKPRITALNEVMKLRHAYESQLTGRTTAPIDVSRLII